MKRRAKINLRIAEENKKKLSSRIENQSTKLSIFHTFPPFLLCAIDSKLEKIRKSITKRDDFASLLSQIDI